MNRYAVGIDIGGQDTKIIRVEDGRVAEFLMNGKCSAGTGRFLDMMASTLGLAPQELYALAAALNRGTQTCPDGRYAGAIGAAMLAANAYT